MGTFEVDPEAIRSAGLELSECAGVVRQSLESFTTALAALGEPWGDDGIGEQWSGKYVPASTDFVTALRSAVNGVDALAGQLLGLADSYVHVENANMT